jgi:hypothetical protein
MALELNVAYGTPSPYEITITVGDKKRTIHRIVNFLSPFTHVVNLDTNNHLNVTTDLGLVRIYSDEQFGEIIRVSVNGNDLNKDCHGGCTITNPGQELKIEAWNLWGGRASAIIGARADLSDDIAYDWGLVAVALFVALLGWVLHRLAKQAMQHFRNLGS